MRALASVSSLALILAIAQPGVAPAQPAPASVAPTSADRLVLPSPKAGHAAPLVVVVADKAGAETTDFLAPYGVLKESGVAEVISVSTAVGPVQLRTAVKIQPDETTEAFDAEAPEGADVVIVPAQVRPDSPALIAWIRSQAAKGATIVSICEGASVLAKAGLLDGKRATTHWSVIKGLERRYPHTTWVRDLRYVQDGRIISTTGVSASIPVSLALVEAMAGHAAARATADRIGITDWSADHHTDDFTITRADVKSALSAAASFWTHETLEAPIADGTDEIALALQTEAWGRTFHARVVTTRPGRGAVTSRRGLVILPDSAPQRGRHVIESHPEAAPGQLDATFVDVARRYGPEAVRLGLLALEYDPPSPPAALALR